MMSFVGKYQLSSPLSSGFLGINKISYVQKAEAHPIILVYSHSHSTMAGLSMSSNQVFLQSE